MNKYYFLFVQIVLVLSACNNGPREHNLELNAYSIYCDSIDFAGVHERYKENVYLPATLHFEGQKSNVKFRLRGDSSRGYPKKSLKVVVLDEQKVNNKKIFNFNAEYKDASFSHSYLSSVIFKELNYPCFKSSMAKLTVNDKFHGLYLEIENMDKDFLIRNGLNPKGDLYKATKDGACLYSVSEVDGKWEKKTNKKSSWAPLVQLIEDLNKVSDEDFEAYIRDEFDYSYLIDYLATNIFIANGSTNYHNYYLYRDAENNGKWILLPWDLDKTLSYYDWKPFDYHSTSSDWENDNPLIERCFLNETIFTDVKERLISFEEILGEEFYEPILHSIQTTLEEAVLKDLTDKVNSVKAWKKAIARELKFLDNRSAKALESIDKFPLSFRVHPTASQLSLPFYLSWDKSADSLEVTYKVYLSKDFLYEDSLTTRVYNTPSDFIEVAEGLALGTYYWKVVAEKNGLVCDGFNSNNNFELRKGTILPKYIPKTISLNREGSPYRIDKPLTIDRNAVLNIEAGAVVLIGHNIQVNVNGGFNLLGTLENKIQLFPIKPNGYFHSINFDSTAYSNTIQHSTIIDGLLVSINSELVLSNVRYEIKNRIVDARSNGPCVILATAGEVRIDSLELFGNKRGQGMNIISSIASVTNSSFYNIPDAIEYIKVHDGLIKNNFVLNSPDDAIDLNGCTNVLIQGNTIANCDDKGISIGASEEGKSLNIEINDNYIFGCAIGLSVKDGCKVASSGNVYGFNDVALQAYRKNQWYSNDGGTILSNTDAFIENSERKRIDEFSNYELNHEITEFSVIQSADTYFVPSDISYQIVTNTLVLSNHSFFNLALDDWALVIDDRIVEFTTNHQLGSKGCFTIAPTQGEEFQKRNYLIDKSIRFTAEAIITLEHKLGEKYYLNYIDQ